MIKRFNRFELKYVIAATKRDAMLAEIREHMEPDTAGDDGVYEVTSLYFDSPDLAFYRSKLDGIKFRRKLRIRHYGERHPDAEARVMLEIKQRINRTTQKRRVAMSLSDAFRLALGGPPPDIADTEDAAVMQEISFLSRSLNVRPTVNVAYVRQAHVGGPYETGLRVTFDHALWCTDGGHGLMDASGRHFMLPLDHVVMEVKANNAVPLWISRMLARHSIPLTRFSKYCTGVACLHKLSEGAEWTS